MVKLFLADENGATAVEYGLMIAIVAAISMTTIKTIGQNLATHWQAIDATIPSDVANIVKQTTIDETTGNPSP